MMTEEQFQSSDIQHVNGSEDGDTNEQDGEITSNTSSAPRVRRSRFFRSKRKQRQNEEQPNQMDDDADASNELSNPSESPGKTIQ
jgi:hypothetical protein